MKKIANALLLLFLLGVNIAAAQTINFEDGFEDGDFSTSPTWSGDIAEFTIVNGDPNYLLQLQGNPAGGVSYLSVPSGNVTGSWQFYIDLSFSPSSSNYAEIFLMSDIANLEGNVNGYALLAGESGSSDVFRIVRYDNGTQAPTPVLSGTTDISSGGKYRIKVTREAGGNWILEVGNGYDGILQQEATGTDNTYTSAGFFGVKATYTSSRAQGFYFDFKIDLPPFTVTDASVNGSQITVTFNRPYDQSTVQPVDFMVDNSIGSPSSVSFPSPGTVLLQFSNPIPSGKYELAIQTIDDLNGITIDPGSAINFIIFADFAGDDVIISEFMYDPPSGQSEYVELRNTSNKYLNLQGWQIADGSGSAVISTDTLALPPNNYLVIAGDTTALSNVYGDRPYFQPGDFPSLNNSGDALAITTGNGTQVDSLNYSSDWGGQAVALERRSPTAPPVQPNFGNSPNPLGGTPGLANEVADDTTPPALVNLTITDDQAITLVFSENLQTVAAENESNFVLDNGISVTTAVQFAPDSVELTLGSPLQNNTTYQLTISNQSDIFGNTAPSDTSFTYYVISPVDSDDIYINEFMYDPPSGQIEYIELYNPTNKSLNLQGWTLNDESGVPAAITESKVVLPPNSFVVIAPDETILSKNPDMRLITMGNDFPSINNGGDAIVITGSTGLQLDSLNYTNSWGGDGIALERRTIDVQPIKANFGEAPNGFGTPGSENQIEPDTTPPKLTGFTIVNGSVVKLMFSEQLDAATATNESNYTISNGLSITTATLSADTVKLTFSGALQNNTQYTLSASNIRDLFGNTASVDTSFIYLESSPVDGDDIFINEFTYDPPSGQTEYIEIYNPTNKSLDLRGWTLNDNSGEPAVITNEQFIIPPGSYVALAPDATLQDSLPSITLIALGSNFPSLNNSGDGIIIRDSGGQLLDSLRYDNSWGGNKVALERRVIGVPPVQANFGDAPNGFGTPGSENQIEPDTTPPKLTGFTIVSGSVVKLMFSEQPDAASATKEGNYNISNGLTIASATLSADTVKLTLSGALQNNMQYTLSASNISDLFGNTTSVDTSFVYLAPSPVDDNDIYINEFMYDPPSGQTEYIELYNPTDKSLDLQGWTLNDNSGDPSTITDNQFLIPPNSYVVLTPDQTLFEDYPGIKLITMGSNFPSFNNSGDDIVIKSRNGTPLDSLRYTDDWGGNEVALERRSVNAPAVDANFGEAPNGFGTPGEENMIEPDTAPPVLNSVDVIDVSTIQILFSESVTGNSAAQKSNYSFSPAVTIQIITSSQNKVTLHLQSPLTSDQEYTLTVENLTDIFGNKINSISKLVVYVKVDGAKPGEIVINEFLINGEPEFIELFNRSGKNIDLSGWEIGDLNNTAVIDGSGANTMLNGRSASGISADISVDQNLILRPGQFLVLTTSQNIANELANGIFVSGLPSFNDDEDAIYIQNTAGLTIDSLFYTPAFGSAVEDKSAEREDPNAASNDPFNWSTSASPTGYTAGTQNAVYQPDKQPPEIIYAELLTAGNKIEIVFNEFIKITSNLTITVGQNPVTIEFFEPTNGNKIIVQAAGISPGKELVVTAENVTDVIGNNSSSTTIPIAQPLSDGDLVINEILFNPIDASDDGLPDQSEYVELYNVRDYAISLEGITLRNASDEDGDIDRLTPFTTNLKWIPAHSTAVIYAGEKSQFTLNDFAKFFELSDALTHSLIRIDASSLSLSSSGDAIFLSGQSGVTIDSVFYEETWHNPNLIDTDGISLERINPDGESNNPQNWGSSTAPKGGTPYAENSLFTQAPDVERESGISFSSNPFSPDGDGFEDNLIISYKLKEADYLMTVQIYDRYGHLIIELADSKPAGIKGTLTWKGLKENGNRNRIGIYIVVFRAFDSANGQDTAFKKTVVLARKLN